MQVAIYARVSTTDQSTDLQRTELEAYAKARGWQIAGAYIDQATGTNEQRPAFRRLMVDARGRKFQSVVVWKLDRWGRSLKNLVLSLQELTDLGISFVSVRDAIDLSTSTGRLMVHMIGAFAEFEASVIRERVMAGLAHAKARGTKLGRPRLDIQTEVMRLRERGKSDRQIARLLGVSPTTVGQVSRKPLVDVPTKGRRPKQLRLPIQPVPIASERPET